MLGVLFNYFGSYFLKVATYFENCNLDKYKSVRWVPPLSYFALEV